MKQQVRGIKTSGLLLFFRKGVKKGVRKWCQKDTGTKEGWDSRQLVPSHQAGTWSGFLGQGARTRHHPPHGLGRPTCVPHPAAPWHLGRSRIARPVLSARRARRRGRDTVSACFVGVPGGALPSFGQGRAVLLVITPDQESTHRSAVCMPFDALLVVSTGIADDVGATGARPNGTGHCV